RAAAAAAAGNHAAANGADGTRLPPSAFFQPGDRMMITLGDVTYAGVSLALGILAAGGTWVRPLPDPLETINIIKVAGVMRIMTTPATIAQLMDAMERH